MILITGATGKLGGAVIDRLLAILPAARIAALVRDAGKATHLQDAGVSVRIGDYNDTAALAAAMQGIDKVLLISGGDADNGLQQHRNVVDAARAAGVQCIAYTGRALRDRHTLVNKLMQRHFDTEDYIKQSGLGYVLFRNILYMDVVPLYVGAEVFDKGIRLPDGGGRVAFALRSEMGEAIANVLANEDCGNRTYDFTGSQTYSFADVAAVLSALSGKEVTYNPSDIPEFEEIMRHRGVPEFFIPRMVGFITDISAGQESTVSNDLADKLGRQPASLKEGLKILFQL